MDNPTGEPGSRIEGHLRVLPGAYIGGFRSGTTLLINLLGLHPAITAWFETKFLAEALRWLKVLGAPEVSASEARHCNPPSPAGFTAAAVTARMRLHMEYDEARLRGRAPSGKRDHEIYPLGADRIHYSLAEALGALGRWQADVTDQPDKDMVERALTELMADLAGRHLHAEPAPLLINKTPELPRFGGELRACLGPHKMILMVRDGREVVRSAAALGWAAPEELAYQWRELILQSRQAARAAPGDYLEIRYEDLVTAPAETLNRLCQFLSLPILGREMVSAYELQAGVAIEPLASSPGKVGDADLDEITRRTAGDLLEGLGYTSPP